MSVIKNVVSAVLRGLKSSLLINDGPIHYSWDEMNE